MKWWTTHTDHPTKRVNGNSSFEETIQSSVALTRLEDLIAWSRKNSIWPFNFGLSC